MRSAARIIAIVLGSLLLILTGGVVVLHTAWFKHAVADYVSGRLDREVVFAGPHHFEWSLRPLVRLEDVRVANADWSADPLMTRVRAIEVWVDLPQLLFGHGGLSRIDLIEPRVRLERAPDGRGNWEFLTDEQNGDGASEGPRIRRLHIEAGRLAYHDAAREVAVELEGDARLGNAAGDFDVRGHGSVGEQPFTLELSGAAEAPDEALELKGRVRLGGHVGRVAGRIGDPMSLQDLRLRLALAGPDLEELAERFGQELPPIGRYRFEGRLYRSGTRWLLSNVRSVLDDSAIAGDILLDFNVRPWVIAELRVDDLDVDAWRTADPEEEADAALAARLGELMEPLQAFDGRLELAVDRFKAFERTLSELALQMELEAGAVTIERLVARVGDGAVDIGASLATDGGVLQGELAAAIDEVRVAELLLEPAVAGVLSGRLQLELASGMLLARPTQLDYDDPDHALGVRLEAETVQTDPVRTRGTLTGEREGEPFKAELIAGPLLRLEAPDQIDPIRIRFAVPEARIQVEGEIAQLLTERRADARLVAQGASLKALGRVLGVELPEIRPYHVRAHVVGERRHWQLRNVDGRLGDSDLAGEVELWLELGEPPRIRADLESRFLDLEDLAVEPVEERERSVSEMLRSLDGELTFRGEQVTAQALPLERVYLRARSDGSRVELRPLELRLGGGSMRFSGFLDADEAPMHGRLVAEVTRVDLADVLPAFGIDDDSGGLVSVRGDLEVSGHAPRIWIYTATGELRGLMTGGRVDTLLTELAGEEAADEIRRFLLPEDDAILDIECAFAAVDTDAGLLAIQSVFIGTPNMNVVSTGEMDLNEQTFDLLLDAETEDVGLLELLSPVELTGPWSQPEVSVITPDLIARGLLAALAAALAPGAAAAPGVLAPLLAGLGDEPTPCDEIIENRGEG